MDLPRTLLIGYGDLAQRLAALLPGQTTGLRRRPQGLPNCVAGDATRAADMRALLARGFDQIVITLTPSARTDAGYQAAYVAPVQVLLAALRALHQRPRIVFVSSTSVYGQANGEWVNECSPTQPAGFAGARLLDAEQLLMSSGLPVVIARLSGLYGPGRERLLSQVRAGGVSRNLLAYSNRIHVQDAALALRHLLALDEPDSCYLVNDDAPVLLAEVVQGLAQALGVAAPAQSVGAVFTGKRVDNSRLKASGWQPVYPDWRAGYRDLLAAFKSP